MTVQQDRTALRDQVVCVRLVGGLGNQMFGAAAAMAIAQRINARIEFDLSFFSTQAGRSYELGVFKLPVSVRSREQARWHSPMQKYFRRRDVPDDWRGDVWREPAPYQYDPSIEAISGSTYLVGYFQSPKYFNDAADLVRRAFNVDTLLSETGRRYADLAKGEQSVAIHIRRGDYVSNPKARAHHGLLGTDYYRKALGVLAALLGTPRVFVISDDLDAARREVLKGIEGITFVEGTTAFDDMHMISACRHHIIANSSFSWWGAWLDSRTGGITIAPRAWLVRDQMIKSYIDDLFPEGWFLA